MSRSALPKHRGLPLSAVRPRRRASGHLVLGLVLTALAGCRGKALAVANAPPARASDERAARQTPEPEGARPTDPALAAPPPVDQPPLQQPPLQQARITEVQHIIADGAAPGRLARFISGCTGEPACQVARRMALGALRTVGDRPARLAALVDAGHAPAVMPEDDPLWPDLVQSLSETWAASNSAAGRKRMLRERDPRTRLLLVSSLAVYAASNRGLSDLSIPQRRVLRGEFTRLYPTLPASARAQIDAFVARIEVNARGTL